jgi:hypothetical protein
MGKAVWRDLPGVRTSGLGTEQIEKFKCEIRSERDHRIEPHGASGGFFRGARLVAIAIGLPSCYTRTRSNCSS